MIQQELENYKKPFMQNMIKKGFLHEIKKNKLLFIMALPGLLFLFINNYLPMLGIVLAFQEYNLKTGFLSKFVGLKNFEYLFVSPNAFIITRNTILYNLLFIMLGLIVAVSFAVVLNEIRNRYFSRIYQSVMFFPYFLSYVVVAYLVYSALSVERGFINNTVLPWLGLEQINWYTEPKYWPLILTITNLWKGIGYGTVIYLSGITGIDTTYYEAAVVDGASKWQQITKITIPFLKPLMVISTIMALGGIFRSDFGLFFQVPSDSGALYSVTDVIDTYVYRALTSMGDIGMASAAGLYQSVVGLIMVFSSNLLIRKIDNENSLF